ncbi:hypothetical protein UFOVP785_87 [uncultured Caudovirales phage]|uniref:Uncharacterized protein n=1 Tax=uncultured Caudovirales phage TaxID=2100421 RepID=A0A6J5NUL4_9CAUD|nr:hypothetical protein UFOVP785_87 [uncultured Caudovirales phage]
MFTQAEKNLFLNLLDTMQSMHQSLGSGMSEDLNLLRGKLRSTSPQPVTVLVGEDGIDVPTCPVGVTVEITETGDGYRHTSRYDHTGRLD